MLPRSTGRFFLHFIFLVEFNRFPELTRTSDLFPGLSSPGKCDYVSGFPGHIRTLYTSLESILILNNQGLYRFWKTWVVLEFFYGIGLESPGKRLLVLESAGNLFKVKYKIRNVWQTKENSQWEFGIERVNVNFRVLGPVSKAPETF